MGGARVDRPLDRGGVRADFASGGAEVGDIVGRRLVSGGGRGETRHGEGYEAAEQLGWGASEGWGGRPEFRGRRLLPPKPPDSAGKSIRWCASPRGGFRAGQGCKHLNRRLMRCP